MGQAPGEGALYEVFLSVLRERWRIRSSWESSKKIFLRDWGRRKLCMMSCHSCHIYGK